MIKNNKGGSPVEGQPALSLLTLGWLTLMILLSNSALAQSISLAGDWQFQTDRNDAGVQEQWFNKKLADNIKLPGSMLTNGKGDEVTLQTKWTGSIYDS